MNQETESINPLHDKDAERAVLGAMLMDKDVFPRVEPIIGDIPTPFFTTDHQLIYDACRGIYEDKQTCDILLVADLLKKRDELQRVGGTIYLYDLQARVVETENTEYHAQIVRDKAIRRQLANMGKHFSSLAVDDNDLTDVLDEAQQNVMELGKSTEKKGLRPIGQTLHETLKEMERVAREGNTTPGLSTGFTDLDILTTGFHPGELVIIAARPNRGKTSLALNIAMNVALNKDDNASVAFFSLEMPRHVMAQRMLSSETGIPFSRIRTSDIKEAEWSTIVEVFTELHDQQNKIHLCGDFGVTVSTIRQEARRLKHNVDNLALVVVDYLQKVNVKSSTAQNREQAVAQVSGDLKELAGELEVPVIACAQINRGVESENRKPVLADLRESGAIEQDADIVGFLHSENELPNQTEADIQLVVRKQRNGPTGDIDLKFYGPIMRFGNAVI